MRIYLAAIALTGTLLAGCSSDWDPARTSTADRAAEQEQLSSLPEAALGARKGPIGFASLPDRGELLSYDRDREVRRSGAYTSHPVEISEVHALNAIAAGGLRLTTPDGKPVNVAYDRIEEHPDGNWTWVGQSESGDHAVLTFGERAVFGEIFADGQSFRVTTRGGRAWVIETDQAALAGHPGHHGDGPEFLIPPHSLDASADVAGSKAMAAVESNVSPKSVTGMIDVVLGYTNGMVSTYGNQATVVTRLTNLVALGNAAYQRSGISMRLRLLHAMQVNYVDNTSNEDVLRKLTGYDDSTGQDITPDPAFNELRSARDSLGADLIALVRQHRMQQEGCGVAWLIGAGQRTITSADARFGYSVVSDGSDVDQHGNTYYCSDYSLVHEFGHNMGQAHNVADSRHTGTHAYSYGYRETPSNGFHTIMAYPSAASQIEIAHFANPLVTYDGRPTGDASTSDNARSMNATMPVVSTFRATKVLEEVEPLFDAKRQDINGDGKADLLWYLHQSTPYFAYWAMSNGQRLTGNSYAVGMGWSAVASGDFRGDQRLDIIWTDGVNMQLWEGNGAAFTGAAMRSYPSGYRIVAVGDVNGDGRSDLVWRDNANTQVSIWIMNGPTIVGSAAYAASPDWRVLGSGDFNGNGRLDLVWTNGTMMQLWAGTPSGFTGVALPAYPTGWQLVGIGDFNGDGRSDFYWRYPNTGEIAIWTMSSGTRLAGYGFAASPAWQPLKVADFSGDGRADIFWTDGASTQVWVVSGTSFVGEAGPAFPTGWTQVRR